MSSIVEKLRSVRIGPFAAFDTLGTVAIALGWSKYSGQDSLSSILMWFVIGDLAHAKTKTHTPGTEMKQRILGV
jgi:hypothetical protein